MNIIDLICYYGNLRELQLICVGMYLNLKPYYVFYSQERARFGREALEMTRLHEQKLQEYIEESEIKNKMEMFEVEERKSSQIARLIESHDNSFKEIRNYYNDITLNNLALISTLKEQMEELREHSDKTEKLMAEVSPKVLGI